MPRSFDLLHWYIICCIDMYFSSNELTPHLLLFTLSSCQPGRVGQDERGHPWLVGEWRLLFPHPSPTTAPYLSSSALPEVRTLLSCPLPVHSVLHPPSSFILSHLEKSALLDHGGCSALAKLSKFPLNHLLTPCKYWSFPQTV